MASKAAKVPEFPFELYPTYAKIVRGDLGVHDYEDALAVVIEFDHVLSKAERATLGKLYDRWCRAIVAESKRADNDLDDKVDFHRFEPLFIGDKAVSGGASRFISANESCAALVRDLAKLKSVVRVAFGDPPESGPAVAVTPTVFIRDTSTMRQVEVE